MLMARQFGIDTDTIVEAIGGSAMDSPMFQTKNPCGQTANSHPLCLKHASKDLNLAVKELEQAGNTLPAVETVAASYRKASKLGYGEQDVSGVYLKLAEHWLLFPNTMQYVTERSSYGISSYAPNQVRLWLYSGLTKIRTRRRSRRRAQIVQDRFAVLQHP